ncbi:MAG: ASKHA domain-containing protein [Chloroflexi bacterium]|nr:ASKHA domain-containing protein [Chloroflexota bacterium]
MSQHSPSIQASQPVFRVVFQPSGRQGAASAGINLLDAARSLGVEIEAICNGRQTCGKCQIEVEEGLFPKHGIESAADHLTAADSREARYWDKHPHRAGRRLACACEVQGDLMIAVPEESQARKQVIRKAATERAIVVDPAVRLYYVEIAPPTLEHQLGDWDRLAAELQARFGLEHLHLDPILLNSLQATLRAEEWKATVTVWQDREVIRVQPGYHEEIYGLAVDIGTTTIAMHLCDMRTGAVLATASRMNPQVAYGEDLMSRVSYCDNRDDGLATLHGVLIAALNELAIQAAVEADTTADAITDIVLVGNTVMHHILLNIPPRELGQSPFGPAISDAVDIKARELGLQLAPGAQAHVLPVEAGHVGADNVGVMVAEQPDKAPAAEIWLIVDVGTNGEILLGNRERLFSASSPTGPAFEGAQIRHGMRAAPGAIERVRVDAETLDVRIKVIGREEWSDEWANQRISESANQQGNDGGDGAEGRWGGGAGERRGRGARSTQHAARKTQSAIRNPQSAILAAGICGSGIIEAVAELFTAGVLTPDGRFAPEVQSPRLNWQGAKAEFVLAWPHETSTGGPIVITSDDVRAIQLGKAALYSGARLLMERAGVDHVDRVLLAGAFGSYIDPFHAMVIGMIPDCDRTKIATVGNSAGDGARICLLNKNQREEARRLARWVNYIGIALEPRFQDAFVEALPLPHAVDAFPHLADELAAAAGRRRARGVSDTVSARERRRRRAG